MTIDHPIWKNFGHAVEQCWHGAQTAVQGFHSSIQGQQNFKSRWLRPNESSKAADKVLDVGKELKPWRMNPTWEDEKARIEVTVPDGALCELNSTFKVGLPPLAVFEILIDPGNRRVFKDIKEVKSRKVLEDYGERQIVEVEQAAIWRFLWLSGTLDVCVKVDQDRRGLSLKYELGREGFMKRFEGSWVIEPLYIDAHEPTGFGRVASLVQLRQVVEPALMPPPPISWYVRGITSRTTEKLLEDLQAEGKRLREIKDQSKSTSTDRAEEEVESEKPQRSLLHRYGKLPPRASKLHRRDRKKWRRINLFNNADLGGAEDGERI
ncbi:unnamed protein product [Calypogeia fissa]